MTTLATWIFIFYLFSSRSFANDCISIFKYFYNKTNKLFLLIFRNLLNSFKPRATKRKRDLPSNKSKNKATNRTDKQISSPQNISISLPKSKYCLASEFHKKIENSLQSCIWRYYVDQNISKGVLGNVVVALDTKGEEPRKFDIGEDCLAINLALAHKIIIKTYEEASLKGMMPIILTLYGRK